MLPGSMLGPMFKSLHHHVVIVGAGFGGLGAAVKLREAGITDVLLLERAEDVGGVWRDNAYPGAACDVQSHLYSFSFAPNPEWRRQFSSQPEIHAYLRDVARDYGLPDRIRFGHDVTALDWEEDRQCWSILTSAGSLTADHVVLAAGVLSDPAIPHLPGLDQFTGLAFHSSQWPEDLDLAGKAVAVVGTGASAIQFVPAIQPQVESLTLFQRTAPWVMPRHNHAISTRRRRAFRAFPWLQQLERTKIYLQRELFVLGFRNPRLMALSERTGRKHLQQQVRDPELRRKLTPEFRLGCKRILFSNDYLRSLDQPNADVVTAGISEVRARSIIDGSGVEHDVDVIVFGTGFRVADVPWAKWVRGRNGRTLAEAWNGSPKAYLGTTTAGFPNLTLIHGPNIGLGHTSVIHMFESQIRHIVAGIAYADSHGIGALEPTQAAQNAFVADIERQMDGTVWTAGGCTSWYLDRTGRNSSLWPGTTYEYRRRVRVFDPAAYVTTPKRTRETAPV